MMDQVRWRQLNHCTAEENSQKSRKRNNTAINTELHLPKHIRVRRVDINFLRTWIVTIVYINYYIVTHNISSLPGFDTE